MQKEKALCSRVAAVSLAAVLLARAAGATVTPEQRCEAGKNALAGRYAACRQTAEERLLLNGDSGMYNAAIAKCDATLATKWQKLEDAAVARGTTCPSTGDEAAVASFLSANAAAMAAALHTPSLPPNVVSCNAKLASYQSGATALLLQTGETACYGGKNFLIYGNNDWLIDCAGTGQDGELQKGIVRQYVDNGDGTITDMKTGLMWEKKSSDGSLHDWGTSYTWDQAFSVFIAGLNSANFAGHNDWRLPNVNELRSLVDYAHLEDYTAPVDPVFNTACAAGCTVTACSCTERSFYWSASSYAPTPSSAWSVYFETYGGVVAGDKSGLSRYVRAVRGS